MPAAEFVDLYEILQLSPNAERDTIKRVHQMLSLKYQLAAPENYSAAQFSLLQQAAATLLDAESRAAYDLERQARLTPPPSPPAVTTANEPAAAAPVVEAKVVEVPVPTSGGPAAEPPTPPAATSAVPAEAGEADDAAGLDPRRFMDGLDIGKEKRTRAALVEICYRQRLLKPRLPALSVKQLEDGLGLPVEKFDASLWYLKETDLLRVSDAGNFSITVRGMNAVEGGFVSLAEGRFNMNGFAG